MSRENRDNSGCFSAILRRILCSGGPQTHPSDSELVTEPDAARAKFVVDDKTSVQASVSSAAPGIVARLMGLDSLPGNNWAVQKVKSPGPVTRSRSVNFMDYLLEIDFTQAKHRRVRTSVSFREVPPSLQQNPSHEFLVVQLEDNVGKAIEAGSSKPKKSEKGVGSSGKQKENVRARVNCKEEKENQGKNKKISKLKNEPRRVSGKRSSKVGSCSSGSKDVRFNHCANSKAKSSLKMVDQKEALNVARKKKEKNQHGTKKVEFEHDSKSSTPVSVLDVEDFSEHHDQNPVSEVQRSMEMEFLSTQDSCPKTRKHDRLTMDSPCISMAEVLEFTEKKSEYKDRNEIKNYMNMVDNLSKLTEEEVRKSNWTAQKLMKFEDLEDICMEFGEHILDIMLHQVVDELAGFHLQILSL